MYTDGYISVGIKWPRREAGHLPPSQAKGRNEWVCIARFKRDDTRAETRFRLSPKRTSPFQSAGVSVQSTAGSRGVRISGSNAGYTKLRGSVEYWLPTPFARFHFTYPPVRHCVPSGFKRTILSLHCMSS